MEFQHPSFLNTYLDFLISSDHFLWSCFPRAMAINNADAIAASRQEHHDEKQQISSFRYETRHSAGGTIDLRRSLLLLKGIPFKSLGNAWEEVL